MSNLKVGIVGLPNVGKSTLFNALLSKQQAFAANYPFATIEPNVGVVPVPDARLAKLAEVVHTEVIKPATVEFLDIAGLVKGASQGEGLGNKFLSHIREASVITHVIRVFVDGNVVQTGSGDMVEDYLTIETELQLADLSTVEKSRDAKSRVRDAKRDEFIDRLYEWLSSGKSARALEMNEDEREIIERELFLLTMKPSIFVLNTGEEGLGDTQPKLVEDFVRMLGEKGIKVQESEVVVMCAKLEEDLAGFDSLERMEYLETAGVTMTGLEQLITASYGKLGLMSFLTAGEKEVRAWTVPVGSKAPEAAGVIHTDFEKKFIVAKVCTYSDFLEYQGWKGASEKGKVRQEGREYVMQEGDVVEFMIGS